MRSGAGCPIDDRYVVPVHEREEIPGIDTVMTSRQPKSGYFAVIYPAQHGGITHSAIFSDNSNGDEFRPGKVMVAVH